MTTFCKVKLISRQSRYQVYLRTPYTRQRTLYKLLNQAAYFTVETKFCVEFFYIASQCQHYWDS